MKEKIYACAFCLSRDLDFMPGGENAAATYVGVGPVSGHCRCKNCGKFFMPISFKSEEDWEKAKKELKKG